MEEMRQKEELVSCIACSDFPTPHVPAFLSGTLEAWINDQLQFFGQNAASTGFTRFVRMVGMMLIPTVLRFVHICTGLRISTDLSRAGTNRAYVVWQEAERRGIVMEHIMIGKHATDCYRARMNNGWFYFQGLPIPPRLEARTYAWTDDKLLFKQFLHKHRVPTADSAVATNIRDARTLFATLPLPVVVKPRIGSRARHTTININTVEEFEIAFRSAQVLCRYVLFEEYLSGALCRATVVNGKLVGFLQKRSPRVTGDGVHTIRELVSEKNAHKRRRVWDIVLGKEHEMCLRRTGYTIDSILENGTTIDISRHSGRQVGGESREMCAEVHPKLRACAEKMATLLSVPVVGFDFIIPDATADPDSQKWGVLEANTLPFIDLHYDPLYGESSNVAGAVWDLWSGKTPGN